MSPFIFVGVACVLCGFLLDAYALGARHAGAQKHKESASQASSVLLSLGLALFVIGYVSEATRDSLELFLSGALICALLCAAYGLFGVLFSREPMVPPRAFQRFMVGGFIAALFLCMVRLSI